MQLHHGEGGKVFVEAKEQVVLLSAVYMHIRIIYFAGVSPWLRLGFNCFGLPQTIAANE